MNVLDHLLDTSIHDNYQIEPEEYAWSKLTGMCCYDVNRLRATCANIGAAQTIFAIARGHTARRTALLVDLPTRTAIRRGTKMVICFRNWSL